MPDVVFPWKRFWYPRGGQISLADDGFLVDPDGPHAKFYNSDAISFALVGQTACVALLGEPGIGKSTALKSEFEDLNTRISGTPDLALFCDLRDYSSEDRLERMVFRSNAVEEWRNGSGRLYLFLDSLDEGLLNIASLSAFLIGEIEKLVTDRLCLRVACRPADWPGTFEGFLRRRWQEQLQVFELAPLRKQDATEAAKLSGITAADKFVSEIIDRRVVAFATKPVTLRFLIRTYKKDGSLPPNRPDLYREGCARLCEEDNPNRRDSLRARPSLSAGQRLAIAARLAAVTQFSNKTAVWVGIEEESEPEDVAIGALIGGMEGDGADAVVAELKTVRESLDTGLFSSKGLYRQGWRHQTFAEYLAARYVHKAPIHRLRSLILHHDGSGKVIPQLREVAAWLAELSTEVFQLLLETQPDLLLRSGVTGTTPADRAELAKRLLSAFEAGSLVDSIWDVHLDFRQLDNPQLPAIIQPYLQDRARSSGARTAAVEIVRECSIGGLMDQIVSIAVNPAEPLRLRLHSAVTIVEIGQAAAKASLRSLVFITGADDPRNDLKGYGLTASWPDHLTAGELFSVLTPAQDDTYYGAYERFLGSDICSHLKPEDFSTAVRWARQYIGGREEVDKLNKLATDILELAVDHLNRPGVLEVFASAIFAKLQRFDNCGRVSAKLRSSSEELRRRVAKAVIPIASVERTGVFTTIEACALRSADVPWLLTELAAEEGIERRRLIAQIISRLLGPNDINAFNAVWEAASSDNVLRAAIDWLVRPIELDSDEARQMRQTYERMNADQSPATPAEEVPLGQLVREILDDNAPETFARVDWALRARASGEARDGEPLPGWSQLEAEVKHQIIGCAYDYLKTRPSGGAGLWGKDGTFSQGMLAGYVALCLLATESVDQLARLTDEDWSFWTPIVITRSSNGVESGCRLFLLDKAFHRAEDKFISTVCDVVESENLRHGQVYVLRNLGEVWNDRLGDSLRACLRGGGIKPKAFRDVLAKLLSMKDLDTEEMARRMATSPIPASGDNRSVAVLTTAELLSHRLEDWVIVWPAMTADVSFGVEVLKTIAFEHEFDSFATRLSEDGIADILIWLSSMGLEREEADPQHAGLVTPSVALSRWWNALVNSLVYRGTPAACRALQRIAEALPQYPGLATSLRMAEEHTRRATWNPLTTAEVIALPAATRKLVISLHGIRTRGAWQKQVHSELQRDGFPHELLDYGHFWALQLLVPFEITKKVDWFRREYERLIGNTGTRPSIIAHSFGTYMVARAIEKYGELEFDRLILCGSLVPEDYDWGTVIRSGRVNAVLNQYSPSDIWVRLGSFVVPGAGRSGIKGFNRSHTQLFQQRRERFSHSDYFFPLNYSQNWLPFLSGENPSA